MLQGPENGERRPDALYRPDRRNMLRMLGLAGAAGLAGCGGDGGTTPTGAETEMPTATGTMGEGMDSTATPTQTQDFGETESPTEAGADLPEISGTYDTVTSAAYSTLNPLFNTEASAGTAIGYALDQGYGFDDQQNIFPLHYEMSTDNGQVWVLVVDEYGDG